MIIKDNQYPAESNESNLELVRKYDEQILLNITQFKYLNFRQLYGKGDRSIGKLLPPPPGYPASLHGS